MPLKDLEKRREYNREYLKRYAKTEHGKAKLYAHTLKWRKKNWEKHLATAKRYRDRHPDRVKASMKRVDAMPYRKAKNELYWQTLDPAIKSAWAKVWQRRRKLKVAKNGGTATLTQWLRRCELYGGKCAYCKVKLGQKAEVDHVIAVSKGGTGWPSNLVPACRSCNATKNVNLWIPVIPKPKTDYFRTV